MKQIYCKFCIQIVTDGRSFFLRFDGGEIATCIQEIPIPYHAVAHIMELNSAQEISNYIHAAFSAELRSARVVSPNEYVGDTLKLIMG